MDTLRDKFVFAKEYYLLVANSKELLSVLTVAMSIMFVIATIVAFFSCPIG